MENEYSAVHDPVIAGVARGPAQVRTRVHVLQLLQISFANHKAFLFHRKCSQLESARRPPAAAAVKTAPGVVATILHGHWRTKRLRLSRQTIHQRATL
jgi:hypothetical protein